MGSGLIFFMVAVLIVGVLLFMAISATRPRAVVLEKEKYQASFLKIEHGLEKADPKDQSTSSQTGDKETAVSESEL